MMDSKQVELDLGRDISPTRAREPRWRFRIVVIALSIWTLLFLHSSNRFAPLFSPKIWQHAPGLGKSTSKEAYLKWTPWYEAPSPREDPPWWSETQFDWETIKPSPKLEYSPCFRQYYCARLEVPLDWNSTDANGPKAAIAVIKRPAIVDVTNENYGGAVLFNPGGPGGSGVQFMIAVGENLSYIVDSRNDYDFSDAIEIRYKGGLKENVPKLDKEEVRYFDLISFDPRGVGSTTPYLPGITDPGRLRLFQQRLLDIGGSFDNEEVFGQVYDIHGTYGRLVSGPAEGDPVAKYVTTASVVRDMIEIVERHGEWRAEAAKKVLKHNKHKSSRRSGTAALCKEVLTRTAWKKGEEKLQYWGFSYGTIIGQTFASMFPDRVGRMVLDGVVNATDYYSGGWRTDLSDTEKINANFTSECSSVGPSECALARILDTENSDLLEEFDELLASLKTTPLTGLVNGNPIFVNHYLIVGMVFSLWYSGYVGYNVTSEILWEVAKDNVTSFSMVDTPLRCSDGVNTVKDAHAAQVAISCIDAVSLVNETRKDYQDYIATLNNLSSTFGNTLAPIMMPCHGFDIRPTYKYDGPFGAVTANPILFASQTLDPITPLRSADGASKLFPGSQVVEAQGIGHTTLGYPNACALKVLRDYFRTGNVPAERTYCAPEVRPFQKPFTLLETAKNLPSLADRKLFAAAVDIASIWPVDAEKKHNKRFELPNWEEAFWHDRRIVPNECGNPRVERRALLNSQYSRQGWL